MFDPRASYSRRRNRRRRGLKCLPRGLSRSAGLDRGAHGQRCKKPQGRAHPICPADQKRAPARSRAAPISGSGLGRSPITASGPVPMCRSTVPARRSTPPNNSSTGSRSCRRSSPEDSGNALPFCAPSRNEYAATLTGGARSARRIVQAARSPRRQHPGWPVIFSLHDGSASGDSSDREAHQAVHIPRGQSRNGPGGRGWLVKKAATSQASCAEMDAALSSTPKGILA